MLHALPPVTPGGISPDDMVRLIGTDAPVILEIGANDGTHTLAFLQLFPKARIYAFEPDPRAAAKFRARVVDERVRLFEIAIGASDGDMAFHVSSGLPPQMSAADAAHFPHGWDQSGSLHAPKTHYAVWPWCKFDATITVKVRQLDSWAHEHGIDAVDFIWADTQGAEGDLIAGGPATLALTRYLYTEYSNDEWYEGQPTLQAIIDLLPNFAVLHRYPMDVLLKNTAR